MRVRSTAAVVSSVVLLLGATTTSCSTGQSQEEADAAQLELERVATALSATVLRPGAERAFERQDHPLDGGLSCTTQAHEHNEQSEDEQQSAEASEDTSGDRYLVVHCTGRTEGGEDAHFEGRLLRAALAERAADDDSLQGDFTGRVGETEVFRMDCLQCSAEPAEEDPSEEAERAEEADEVGQTKD